MTIDWACWQPRQHATLLFVIRDGEILLIRKKRGLGAGKINGPGGVVDPGETPLEAAVREVEEELEVTPREVSKAGEIWFQVTDGTAIRIHVYRAETLEGEPVETEEAIPLWVSLDAIPYPEMWEDDRLWLPLVLEGRPFQVNTLFDGDRLVEHELHLPGVMG